MVVVFSARATKTPLKVIFGGGVRGEARLFSGVEDRNGNRLRRLTGFLPQDTRLRFGCLRVLFAGVWHPPRACVFWPCCCPCVSTYFMIFGLLSASNQLQEERGSSRGEKTTTGEKLGQAVYVTGHAHISVTRLLLQPSPTQLPIDNPETSLVPGQSSVFSNRAFMHREGAERWHDGTPPVLVDRFLSFFLV